MKFDENWCDKNGDLILKKVPYDRPKDWPEIDYKVLKERFEYLDGVESLMVNNTCRTTEVAIKAIERKRKADDDSFSFLSHYAKEKAKDHYIRTHYNDLEADNYERQEERQLNG